MKAQGEAQSAALIGNAIQDNPSFISLRKIEVGWAGWCRLGRLGRPGRSARLVRWAFGCLSVLQAGCVKPS